MHLPPPLSWFYEAWMEFSKALGMVMSKIILTILWIVGFGTYGIIMKVLRAFKGKAPTPSTYWIDIPPPLPDDLHHQF